MSGITLEEYKTSRSTPHLAILSAREFWTLGMWMREKLKEATISRISWIKLEYFQTPSHKPKPQFITTFKSPSAHTRDNYSLMAALPHMRSWFTAYGLEFWVILGCTLQPCDYYWNLIDGGINSRVWCVEFISLCLMFGNLKGVKSYDHWRQEISGC